METEIWKSHPDIPGIEVSTLGRVRTLDKVVSSEIIGTRFYEGRVLKSFGDKDGYIGVRIKVNDKFISKKVHRLVAQTFIPNPDNFPEVNHKNCVRDDNRVSNLEWCTHSYNNRYRKKHGVPQMEATGHRLFAIDLATMEISHFRAQTEASRALGLFNSNISRVVKGECNQTGGYWFKEDDGNGIEIDMDKLKDIAKDMHLRQDVFAVNLDTLEVSHFRSQSKASRELGVKQGSISNVIRGKANRAGGFWFTNADDNAVDAVRQKLDELGETELKAKDGASAKLISQVANYQSVQ